MNSQAFRIHVALRGLVGLLVALFASCGVPDATAIVQDPSVDVVTATPTFEEFRARYAWREPQTGLWIADGATVFASEKLLREFYDERLQSGELIVNRVANADDIWDAATSQRITYCVSNAFGARKDAVIQSMRDASAEWMAAANVKFVYLFGEDAACAVTNTNVVFDVEPVSGAPYIARAFFPSSPRSARQLLIGDQAFTPGAAWTLTGVLRHELGHALGFRHEHTRPESGTCFENNDWRALTPYDSASVMHYPQCNGISSWALALTEMDKQGAAALYGAVSGNDGGSGGGGGGSTGGGGGTVTETYSDTVAKGHTKSFSFPVAAGSQLSVVLSGQGGDADLYVRFGLEPTRTAYACRPYLDDSNEQCLLTVPAGASWAFVHVVGATRSTYEAIVNYTPSRPVTALPGESCAGAQPIATDGTPVVGNLTGYVGDGIHCSVGLDRYYTFTLTEPSFVSLSLTKLLVDDYQAFIEGPAPVSTCANAAPQCGTGSLYLGPGTYYVAVVGGGFNRGDFSANVTAVPTNGGESCNAPTSLPFNGLPVTTQGTTVGQRHDRTGSCGGGLGDVVYAITTPRAGKLTARVETTNVKFRPVVYVQQGGCSTSGNVSCNAAPARSAQVTTGVVPAGTYFVWVDGVASTGATNGSFTLTVAFE